MSNLQYLASWYLINLVDCKGVIVPLAEDDDFSRQTKKTQQRTGPLLKTKWTISFTISLVNYFVIDPWLRLKLVVVLFGRIDQLQLNQSRDLSIP